MKYDRVINTLIEALRQAQERIVKLEAEKNNLKRCIHDLKRGE